MKRMTVCLSLFLFLGLAMNGLFAQGLEVSPVRFDFALEAGNNQTRTLTIRNTSNKRATYTLSAQDWYLDETGNVIRQGAGENKRSCAEWMTFSPALVDLEANAAQDVQVTLNVPSGESSTKWSIAYITLQKEQTAPQADKDLTMGIEVSQAIGVFITQSPQSNRNASAKISDFRELAPSASTERKFAVITENTGDKIIDCKLYLVVSDLQKATEERLEPISFQVLPEGTSIGELSIPQKLKKGSYMIAAVLDYGSDYPLEGSQIQLEVK